VKIECHRNRLLVVLVILVVAVTSVYSLRDRQADLHDGSGLALLSGFRGSSTTTVALVLGLGVGSSDLVVGSLLVVGLHPSA
jgi:hypothetical protein